MKILKQKVSRVRRLLGKLSEVRRLRFSQRLFARGPSPLSIKVWQQALPQIVDASSTIRQAFNNIFSSDPVRTQVRDSGLAIGFAALIAILFSWPLHSWLLSRFGRNPNVKQPGFMEAMRAMVVVGVVRSLFPTAAAALIYIVAINNIHKYDNHKNGSKKEYYKIINYGMLMSLN